MRLLGGTSVRDERRSAGRTERRAAEEHEQQSPLPRRPRIVLGGKALFGLHNVINICQEGAEVSN